MIRQSVLRRRAGICLFTLFAFPVLLSQASMSWASSVEPMSVRTMADFAGQVILGDVSSLRSYWAENPRRIETEVVFSHVQYLKGRHATAGESFTLIVPGGTVGERTMRICCAPAFKTGERRLLFLLPTYKTFPTVGLDQGAFEIRRDADGVERVYQERGMKVIGLDVETFVRHGGGAVGDVHRHLREANGAVVRSAATSAESSAPAISLDEFLRLVQPILDASTDQEMTEPAGRRVLVEYRATTLKSAPGTSTAPTSSSKRIAAPPPPRRGEGKTIERPAADVDAKMGKAGGVRKSTAVQSEPAKPATNQGGER